MRTSRGRLRSVGVLRAASSAVFLIELAGSARGQVDRWREGRQRRQLREGMLQPEGTGGEHHVRDGPHHAIRAAQEALEGIVEQRNVLQEMNSSLLMNFEHSTLLQWYIGK